MRLIDADKLRFRHTVKCNSDTTRPYTLNCISFDEVQNAPTIKAVPIDVLDKIRAEILEEKECAYADFERYKVEYLGQDWEDAYDSLPHDDFRYGMERCIEILDKCRNEVGE